jgi:peptidoglycan/xylan/chitin deacetylase (PgdA/CDA1 family)
MYHSIDTVSGDYLTVSADRFREHLIHLSSHYRVLSIGQVLQGWEGGENRLADAVVISFDDAPRDNYLRAAPLLEAFGLAASFFVVTGAIGQDNRWNHRAYRILPHMTADDLADLCARGFEVQSHTLTHQRLPKLSAEEIDRELREPIRVLQQITGVRPTAVSYPYGDADARCLESCRMHYRLGFASARQGASDWREEPARIRRIYVSPADDAKTLDHKIAAYRRGEPRE